MKLGLYTFAALTLILLIGAFVYTLELGFYTLEIINLKLPITVWIVLPAVLLFIFTITHMLFYSLRNYLQIKKWKKDTEALEDSLYWSLVSEPKEQKYNISEVKSRASLLDKATLQIKDNVDGLSPRLSKIVNITQKIKNGEYIDLKEEKISKVFTDGNPLLIQNRLNRLESDEKFVEEVMRSNAKYSKSVQKEALDIYAKTADFEQARKYTKIFDVENFLHMLNRISNEDDLKLNKDLLSAFISDLKVSCANFIKIAEVTKKYFKPDENLALFNSYQKENEKAQNAYLYLLFEYELMDQVAAFLEEQEENEFMKFRALYQLKKEDTKYKLEDIIDIHSVCTDSNFISR